MNKKTVSELVHRDSCTCCGLCQTVCNKGAISFKTDILGFQYPIIDQSLCVDCGLCAKKCPSINPLDKETGEDCYLAWSKNKDTHFEASSGGVATEMAKYILKTGGFVVGCIWDKDFNAIITVLDREVNIKKMMGSKYVQSYIDSKVWKGLEERIEKGQQGLVIGLPCQVAAIKRYTSNNKNLFFVDLLCHGGCSPNALKEHVGHLINKHHLEEIDDIRFRGGVFDCKFTLWNKGKCVFKDGQYTDKYFGAFMRRTLFKEACYSCQYATRQRVSDITLADFWGVDQAFLNKRDKMNGNNLIIINSEKGNVLWQNIKDRFEYWQRNIEEAIAGNDTLKQPTERPKERDKIINHINKGFERAVWYDKKWRLLYIRLKLGIIKRKIIGIIKK